MLKITKSNLDYNVYILSSFKTRSSSKAGTNLDLENDSNLSAYYRAKNTIRDYAKNNNFNYFLTITFDSKKVDISNELYIKKTILKRFNNFKNRYDSNFKYIIVAERGKKTDRLHFHGLIYMENTKSLKHIGGGNYRDSWLFDNFGANCFKPIKEYSMKVVNYITKYITKDSYQTHIYKYNYFCSNGLKRSEVVYKYADNHEFVSRQFDFNFITYLLKWLNENNLIEDYQFCSYANITNEMFTNFLESHNLLNNENYKQISFNDLP